MAKTISITSGKGGVGKTTLTANLALHLAGLGRRVLILDGDMAMANVDVMFGLRPKRNLLDLLNGRARLDEILLEAAPRVSLLPGGSGLIELQHLDHFKRRLLFDELSRLDKDFDCLLIDTAPGIDDNVLYLNSAAQEIVVVVTPDPSSLTDSYALIKVLNRYHDERRFSIICNDVQNEAEGLALFRKLNEVAGSFLYISLDYLGSVPTDGELKRATKSQRMVVKANPDAISSRAIGEIGSKLGAGYNVQEAKGGLQIFWSQLAGVSLF